MLSPMGTMYAHDDGTCGEQLWDYYEVRARGGTGLIIFETASVGWPNGASMPNMVGFSEDRFDGLAGLDRVIRCFRSDERAFAFAADRCHRKHHDGEE